MIKLSKTLDCLLLFSMMSTHFHKAIANFHKFLIFNKRSSYAKCSTEVAEMNLLTGIKQNLQNELTKSFLNFAGNPLFLCGMCKSPSTKTS